MKRHYGALTIAAALLLGSQHLYAQTCSSITATAPDSRYTDNSDGTVTDNQTGLMWKQCSEGQSTTTTPCDTGIATYIWQDALTQAQTVNSAGFAGHNDWRLPNLKELSSLVEMACSNPAINTNLFQNTTTSSYWSSSPNANYSSYVWVVGFYYGNAGYNDKVSNGYVRLVRGGQ